MSSSSSSSSALKVNTQGLTEAIAFHSGLTGESARGEYVDNSEDAEATKIVLAEVQIPVETGDTDPKTKKPLYKNVSAFCHGDNGKGFTKDELDAHHHLHNIKVASAKHGRMGYGGTAAECYESQLEGISKILTVSKECNQLLTKVVNWKRLHETGEGVGPAHVASAEEQKLWDALRTRFGLADYHGSLIFVQVPSTFKDVLAPAAIAAHCSEIGTTYFEYIASGKTITVFDRDGKEYPVAAIDSLSWNEIADEPNAHLPKTSRSFKKEYTIEMWKNNDTGKGIAFRVDYQKRGTKKVPVRRGLTKNAKGKFVLTAKGAEANVYPPKNSTKVNTIRHRGSYKASGIEDKPTNSGGKIRLKRNGRITQSYDPPLTTGGFEQRLGIDGSNHVIELDYMCDWFAPPEVDKSRANVANLDAEFWTMVTILVVEFANHVAAGLKDYPEAHTANTSTVRGADSGSEASAEAERESESEPEVAPAHVAEPEPEAVVLPNVPAPAPLPEVKVVPKLITEEEMEKELTAEQFAAWKREAFALQSKYLV